MATYLQMVDCVRAFHTFYVGLTLQLLNHHPQLLMTRHLETVCSFMSVVRNTENYILLLSYSSFMYVTIYRKYETYARFVTEL